MKLAILNAAIRNDASGLLQLVAQLVLASKAIIETPIRRQASEGQTRRFHSGANYPEKTKEIRGWF
jgi:hypothetical protein